MDGEGKLGIRLYGISNCDTVKRARAWLREQGVAHEFHDFKKTGVPAECLPVWVAAVGLARLINRQGTTWRALADTQRAQAEDAAQALGLLSAQPSLIKRPVVAWPDGTVSVGFEASAWAERLSA